jgi:hypothetical protein
MTSRGPWSILAALAVLGILAFTLTPARGSAIETSGFCLVCGERGLANIIGNVLLFLPLGAALVMAGVRPGMVILVGLLLSAGIEVTQHWVPGRNPNPTDTFFNTLGAAAGAALPGTRRWWARARGSRRLGLGAAALVGALCAMLTIGWLLGPGYPEADYYGQWTPDNEERPSLPGRVLAAQLGAVPIPSTRLADPAGIRRSLRAGELLAVHAVMAPGTERPWPVFRMAAGQGTLVVTVARQWDDLLLRFHTRAAMLRLSPPQIRVAGAFAGADATDPVHIRVWRVDGGYCVEVDRPLGCGHGFTVGRAWSLLHRLPFLDPPARRVLDAAFLAILLVPVGFWWRRSPEVAIGGAVVIAALLLVPAFTQLRPTPPAELAGAIFGLVSGVALGRAFEVRA